MKYLIFILSIFILLTSCKTSDFTDGSGTVGDFEIISSKLSKGRAIDFTMVGSNMVYVADSNAGITTFSVGSSLHCEDNANTPYGYSVVYDGIKYAYMAAGLNGIYAYDTDSINGLQTVGHLSEISASEIIYEQSSQKLYVAAYNKGLQVVDAAIPTNLTVTDSWENTSYKALCLAKTDDIIALGCERGLYILNKNTLDLIDFYNCEKVTIVKLFKCHY